MGRKKSPEVWKAAAAEYAAAHGSLRVPAKYVTPDGLRLGRWTAVQRKKAEDGTLSPELASFLSGLGMETGNQELLCAGERWEKNFALLSGYSRKYGTSSVPLRYRAEDGTPLGRWLQRQRVSAAAGTLSAERTGRLAALGVPVSGQTPVSDTYRRSGTSFAEQTVFFYASLFAGGAANRCRAFGPETDVYMPAFRCAVEYDGARFHRDPAADAAKEKVLAEQGVRLVRIRESGCPPYPGDCPCFVYRYGCQKEFADCIRAALSAADPSGNAVLPDIDPERDSALIAGQASFGVPRAWTEMYGLMRQYTGEYGKFPSCGTVYGGRPLGRWVQEQRTVLSGKRGVLSPEQRKLLAAAGFPESVLSDMWYGRYRALAAFRRRTGRLPEWHKENGHYSEECSLKAWTERQLKRAGYVPARHPMTETERALLRQEGIAV